MASAACARPDSTPADDDTARLIARGDSLDQDRVRAPAGNALEHSIASFAKALCSAVFLTGLDPQDAAANVGFFTGPLKDRGEVTDTAIDRNTQTVRLTMKSGTVRVAHRFQSQGCITLAKGEDSVHFTPSTVTPNLPDPASTPWPMGDVLPNDPWPAGVDSAKVARALETGFGPPEAMTLAFLVTHKGRIIAERYADGIGIHSPLESWSMGKSLTGTLVARLIQLGVYTLDQPAPIPEWQNEGDGRREIRIADIMRMSSGIRIRAPYDPDYDRGTTYPDHLYLYTGGVNSYHYAATRPQQWLPGTVGRYRNTDPVLASYLVRLGAEKLGQDYHSFPQRQLFDKIGIRNAIIETDPYGNFLGQGYELVAARDWARLANLYLQDGVWNGERLLPEGYVDYARTLAPAWVADGRPIYGGGFFWLNGDGGWPLPKETMAMLGAGGQSAHIVPSKNLVIVRIGKYRGSDAGEAALTEAMKLLAEAIPDGA
ncbi:MAG: serine hydrolase [Gemmatimonadales bacterium]